MDKYSYQLYQDIINIFWKFFFIVGGIVGLSFFFPYIKNVVVMLVISSVFAIILRPVVDFLVEKGVPHGVAILLNIIIVLGLIIYGISQVIPAIISTVQTISATLQSDFITNFEKYISRILPQALDTQHISNQIVNQINDIVINIISSLGAFLKSIGSIIATTAIIPLITFFLLKDKQKIQQQIVSIIPNKYFELSLNIIYKIGRQISKYITGTILQSIIIGTLSIIGLAIINLIFNNPVPSYVLIGSVAGIANMIPYIGPITGAIPALLVATVNVQDQANLLIVLIWIAATFGIVQLIDNSLVRPLVVSKSVDLHPITVVAVVLIGGKIAGILGMFLGVPVTGIIKVTISQISWGIKNYSLKEFHSSTSSRSNT